MYSLDLTMLYIYIYNFSHKIVAMYDNHATANFTRLIKYCLLDSCNKESIMHVNLVNTLSAARSSHHCARNRLLLYNYTAIFTKYGTMSCIYINFYHMSHRIISIISYLH